MNIAADGTRVSAASAFLRPHLNRGEPDVAAHAERHERLSSSARTPSACKS